MSDFDSSLPVRTETPGDIIAKIADATVPSQQLTVNADGSINITDNGGSLTVDGTVTVTATDLDIRNLVFATDKVDASGSTVIVTATDLDIRNLSSAQDSVEVLQATHDNLNANANIQVGDADVANGNPVPVSDAGGSLTVDASNLDIRDLVFATDKVDVSGSSVTVTATNLDIRDLTHASDSVKVGDGADFLAVNADGSINVVVSNDLPGTEICAYNTSASLAGGASVNFDYTVTALNTLTLEQAWTSGSGKIKTVLGVETAAASGTYNTKFVGFNSTSSANIEMPIKKLLKQVAGAKIRITITNRDVLPQDVYSTLTGSETT